MYKVKNVFTKHTLQSTCFTMQGNRYSIQKFTLSYVQNINIHISQYILVSLFVND